MRQFDIDLRFIIESILGEVFLAISNALNEYMGLTPLENALAKRVASATLGRLFSNGVDFSKILYHNSRAWSRDLF